MHFLSGDVKWGIVGCGDVCEVKSGPGFQKTEHSSLVAVMRRDKEKARDFAERHHVPKFYDSADDLIADPDINAIYVATPPVFHEEYVYRALKAGKPVYVEKPVALNSAACERMISAQKTFGLPVTCAHYRRALPLFRTIREIIRSGTLGAIRLVMIQLLQAPATTLIAGGADNWRVDRTISGGGYFHDLAPHQLDILYWIFGKPVDVKGRSLNQVKAYDAPDVTTLEILFPGDVLCQGLWAFDVNIGAAEETCRIIGDDGFLSFSFFRDPVLYVIGKDGSREMNFEYPPHIQQPMINDVVRYFRGEADNPCSLEEALVTLQMMDCTL